MQNAVRATAICAAMAAISTGVTVEPVAAQTPNVTAPGASGEWEYLLTPYLFLPLQTKSTSTVAGQTSELDLNLQEILELLQGALSVRFEAWKGRFGISVDGYYVFIGGDGTLPAPITGLPAPLNVDVDVKQSWGSILGSYRFAEGMTAANRPYSLSFGAGAKYNSITQDIKLTTLGFPPQVTLGGTEGWWEPTVALQGGVEVADRWVLGGRAEFGGFGVNGNELSYLVLFGADWRAWENTSLRFGYQFYGIDFSTNNDSFAYKVDQHGVYLGATFRF